MAVALKAQSSFTSLSPPPPGGDLNVQGTNPCGTCISIESRCSVATCSQFWATADFRNKLGLSTLAKISVGARLSQIHELKYCSSEEEEERLRLKTINEGCKYYKELPGADVIDFQTGKGW